LLQLDQTADRDAVRRMLDRPFVDVATDAAAAGRRLEVIDDFGMQTEFRHGRGLLLE